MATALAILGFLQWVVFKLMIKYLIILNLMSILKCYMYIENSNENKAKQTYFKIKSQQYPHLKNLKPFYDERTKVRRQEIRLL